MNKRIRQLAEQCTSIPNHLNPPVFDQEKFAELIVDEACRALHPMLRDQISRGQGVDLIKQHFGVEE